MQVAAAEITCLVNDYIQETNIVLNHVYTVTALKYLIPFISGEFGMVFRAHWYKDVALPEVVAVKTLKGKMDVATTTPSPESLHKSPA